MSTRLFRIGIPALALAGALIIFRIYHRDIDAARVKARSGSTMVQSKCGPVEYAEAGAGIPVLSIHGTGGGWDQGLFIARGLVDHGFRVIAPSRYGYLRTPIPANASPENEADMLACFLDAIGVARVSVIAASAGATPGLQLALRHPERIVSLVLLVPAIGGINGPPESDAVSPFIMNVVLGSDFPFWAAMKVWPKATLTVVAVPASLVPTLAPEDRKNLHDAIAGILPVAQRRRGILYDASNQSREPRYPLEQIDIPTLAISAEDDLYGTLANARVAAALIPGARLIIFKSGGHLLLGHEAELWPAVAKFMKTDIGSRASPESPAMPFRKR